MISTKLACTTPDLPPPPAVTAEWSTAAIRLLQGVVYNDDNTQTWERLLASTTALSEYFGRIGLKLVVNEAEGMAYLRQADDLGSEEAEHLPRLFRRTPLGYDTSLLCVILRDLLRQFEEEELQHERCVVTQADLFGLWQGIFCKQNDDVKLHRSLQNSLRKLEELKFVKLVEQQPPSWEIRRIIKARIPLEELERLRASLMAAAASKIPGILEKGDDDGS
jgi:hypothetical protein